LQDVMLAESLLAAPLLALGWWPPSPHHQVPREPAQQPSPEGLVAHVSAQEAPPEHPLARL